MSKQPTQDGESSRQLVLLITFATLLSLAVGYALPAFALVMERQAIDPTLIGLNAGSQNLAIVVVGPLLAQTARFVGMRRLLYLMVVLSAGSAAVLALVDPPYAWFPFRILFGGCLYVAFILGETWISQGAGERRRGRVVAIYGSFFAGGLFAGPLLVQLTGAEGLTPFIITAGLALASGLPLLFLKGFGPPMEEPARWNPFAMLVIAPTIMAASMLYGIVDAALLSLLPIYGLHAGLEESRAILLLTVCIAGAITFQFPLMHSSDRLGRRRVLIGCGWGSLGAAILLPFVIQGNVILWVTLFIYGGVTIGLWVVSMAILGDRFKGADLVTAFTAYAMFYAIGATVGPSIAGAAMEVWDPHGMAVTLGLASALFLGLATFRSRRRHEAT
jgi:MFS family permease